jgi:sugar phosphate isomerase/epimerase
VFSFIEGLLVYYRAIMSSLHANGGMTRRSLLLAAAAPLALRSVAPAIGFCIGTYGMKDLSIEAALRLIASTGYDGVELALMPGFHCDPAVISAGDRERVRALLRETRLTLAAMNDMLPITPDDRARSFERLKLDADLAHDLAPESPPVLDLIVGGTTAGWPASRALIIDELGSWARLAEQRDVTLCFKPHASQAIHNPARALDVLRAVNSPRLKICYDYCHMFVAGESLENSLRALGPHLGFITLKDARWTAGGHEFLLPGDGDTDYQLYFRLLKELGYKGWVAAEVTSMIWRKAGYDPAAAARRAYENIAPAWKVAGLER